MSGRESPSEVIAFPAKRPKTCYGCPQYGGMQTYSRVRCRWTLFTHLKKVVGDDSCDRKRPKVTMLPVKEVEYWEHEDVLALPVIGRCIHGLKYRKRSKEST